MKAGLAKIDQFYADAAAGSLPSFCLVEPVYGKQSEEDPQDLQFGDRFMSQVVEAVLSGLGWAGLGWAKTMLI